MNKLILIGNGFDLAHGLPTSYSNFLSDFWENLINEYENDDIKSILYINPHYSDCINFSGNATKSFNDFKKSCLVYISNRNGIDYHDINIFKKSYQIQGTSSRVVDLYVFKNNFFYVLNTYFDTHNWVDIENAYYDILTSLVKSDQSDQSSKYGYTCNIDILNNEFNAIKRLLEKYIKHKVLNKFDIKLTSEHEVILSSFKNKIHYIDDKIKKNVEVEYLNEFTPEDKELLIKKDNELINKKDKNNIYINEILFLDFNYTNTVDTYITALNYFDNAFYPKPMHISIHGKIEDKNNPINFGFGDEMDDNYKALEKTGDNKYLENIKSFMYLNNSNYKKLLNWINSEKFQVFVMGHSCGLSDRTMLNTIFEHHNCRSIKVFYHKKESGDNFTEIVQNISRHFNKKSLMREKLVDKSLSIPLPQTARFKEI
ncbi:hypothetical protein HZP37_08445 [Elizabethkingia anophelis]|nr:hypothetical protein [Elizabethkingia anophelis]